MFCEQTARRHGTRNYVGQVWVCACAADGHGCHHSAAAEEEGGKELPSLMMGESGGEMVRGGDLRIVLVSGKRAAGKDYLTDLLHSTLLSTMPPLRVTRCAISDLNKAAYAKEAGVELERLRNDREFKESHRLAMIEYHKQRNQQDPEWCLSQVMAKAIDEEADVLLVSDLRTHEDLVYFQRQAPQLVILRVDACDEARRVRGWSPDARKDTLHTETDLDTYQGWSACVDNSDNSALYTASLAHWVTNTAVPRILH